MAWCSDGSYSGGTDDDNAVNAGIWGNNEYVDTQNVSSGFSLGLKVDGVDNNTHTDWILYKTPSAGESNSNGEKIPEFADGAITPICIVSALFIILRRKRRD